MASNSLVSGHELNRLLDRVILESSKLKSPDLQKLLDENQRAGAQRILFFAQQLKEHLASVSDFEVSVQALDTLNNQMQAALNELNAFLSNRNAGHISNAMANLDGAIQTFGWAFYKRPAKGSTAYGESIRSIEKAAEAAVLNVESLKSGLAQSITELQSQVSNQQGTLDGLKITSQELSSQNTAALQNFENQYKQMSSNLEETFTKKLHELEGRFDNFEDSKIEQSRGLVSQIEEHEAKAREIVQIVGNIGLTGNYQNRASTEMSQADILRFGAILFFIIGAFILGYSIFESIGGTVQPLELAARAVAALTISAPAIYLAKESARHRSNADRAKQTELELASLGPFLDSLPDDGKQEVIRSLSRSYFGRDVEPHTAGHPAEIGAEELMKILLRMIENGK